MKKTISVLLIALTMFASVFAAKPKVEPYVHDYSKQFYPGFGYVLLNSSAFRGSTLVKADILKNEYVVEKVNCLAALVPITLTLKVTLEKDGNLTYEYSDLVYKKDGKKTQMSNLVSTNAITNDFNKLLPECFNNEEKYNAAKAQFFESPALIGVMADGLTEIRAAKFTEVVKGETVNLKLKVTQAKMNENADYADYSYRIACYVSVGVLKYCRFEYYTNDDDKASAAENDVISVTGKIDNFTKSKFNDTLCFVVIDEE